jgi:hypothetical protein
MVASDLCADFPRFPDLRGIEKEGERGAAPVDFSKSVATAQLCEDRAAVAIAAGYEAQL